MLTVHSLFDTISISWERFPLNLIFLNVSKLATFRSSTRQIDNFFDVSILSLFIYYLSFATKFNSPSESKLSKYFKTDNLQIEHSFAKVILLNHVPLATDCGPQRATKYVHNNSSLSLRTRSVRSIAVIKFIICFVWVIFKYARN